MTHKRYANKVDANQPDIVKDLNKIPGVAVKVGYDDIIVGYRGRTYWYEIKNPEYALKKDGTLNKGALRDSQVGMENEFTGHYKVVTSTDEILKDLGII